MFQRGWHRIGLIAMTGVVVWATAGCGNSAPPAEAGKEGSAGAPPAPVTLNFFTHGNSMVLAETIETLVRQKFPHITIRTTKDGKGTTIFDVLNAGQTPDLISYSLGSVQDLRTLRLLSDLTPLIQQHKFDLNRLVPGAVEAAKAFSDKGELLLMPFELNNNAIYYNKTIFDKFGVSYPQDGMTWEQLLDLAKKVTRTDGGVSYKGFQYSALNLVYKDQLALGFVDPKTNKAAVNNDAWKRWLDVMTSFYKIDGNAQAGDEKANFLKNQTVAMRTGPNYLTELPAAMDAGLNVDFAALPRFEGMSAVSSQMNAPFYVIPPSTPHKDEAFQVIAYLLSDEVQTLMARQGRIPIVKEESVRKEYAKDLKGMDGKNLAAFFQDAIAKPAPSTPYDGQAKSIFTNAALVPVYQGKADINTALREAEEQINKFIEAEQKK
ncbi:ABC transporter substrate-binding protein [Paenibacillus hodogayensis]|uniref:ABC transporter substrate-binding protein n=1 Tax=Paenibacillus hodogayensis TaxID=279208 RepID=A0ABV5VVC3_9BACL